MYTIGISNLIHRLQSIFFAVLAFKNICTDRSWRRNCFTSVVLIVLVVVSFYRELPGKPLHNWTMQTKVASSVSSAVNDHTNNYNDQLKIAWLMSYPNSGTTYTLSLVSQLTNLYTASVYGKESEEAVGESNTRLYDQNGPFWVIHSLNASYPTEYVFVKTHCGSRSNFDTADHFTQGCLMNIKRLYNSSTPLDEPHLKDRTWTSAMHVHKAIHLIRNPFDNIVSRFRFEWQHKEYHHFNLTKEGFRDYCDYTINKVAWYEYDFYSEYLPLLEGVPCKWDFLRYFNWHNRAFETTAELKLDTLVLKYDQYSTNFANTVSTILNFLQMDPVGIVQPFIDGKVYGDYFTQKERIAVKQAYLAYASKTTRIHLDPYFMGI